MEWQLLDVSLALTVLSRYHALKFLVLKSDPATRANVSSFLVVRLNSNTENCANEVQPRSLEPSSKILCTSMFRLAEQLPGPKVCSKNHLEEKMEKLRPDSRLAQP